MSLVWWSGVGMSLGEKGKMTAGLYETFTCDDPLDDWLCFYLSFVTRCSLAIIHWRLVHSDHDCSWSSWSLWPFLLYSCSSVNFSFNLQDSCLHSSKWFFSIIILILHSSLYSSWWLWVVPSSGSSHKMMTLVVNDPLQFSIIISVLLTILPIMWFSVSLKMTVIRIVDIFVIIPLLLDSWR